MATQKYPSPLKKNGRYYCPAKGCDKSYKSKRGYRYHYRSQHYSNTEKEKGKTDKEKMYEITENVMKKVMESSKTRKRLKAKISKADNLNKETWLLKLGDIHYGLRVKPIEVGKLGKYNAKIAKERLNTLANTLIRFIDYHPNVADTLYIALEGDMIDNAIMRNNQYAEIEFGVAKQVMDITELLVDFLVLLSKHFKTIKCFGIFGNHGRMTQKKTSSKTSDNFDRLVYWGIEERIQDMKDISIQYTPAQHMIFDVHGWKFWLEHGDTVRSWMGIPFYGARREKAHIQEMLAHFNEHADYVLMGHHHQAAEFQNIFLNGSFPGGDKYSIGHLRRMDLPCQVLLSIDDQHGVVWKRKIMLEPDIQEQNIKVYS